MRIVCISDTHGSHNSVPVPDGDVLVFAGDYTRAHASKLELELFNKWLGSHPHKHKVMVAGNHDRLFEDEPRAARSRVTNAVYLQNSGCEIEGLNFYGAPQTPRFFNWAFNVDRGEAIQKYWNLIPTYTDVLITHGPPQGILDTSRLRGDNLGCEALYQTVLHRVQPKLHIFGHIHGGHGIHSVNGTTFVNAAIMTEKYNPYNTPVVVDI